MLDKTRRGGPSVAGTIGFMAPEQLTGHAEPATDLFGVGALAVALLSRRDPAEMLDDAGQLDWKAHVSVSPRILGFLESLLYPRIDGRPKSARAAIAALEAARKEPEVLPAVKPESAPRPRPDSEQPVVAQEARTRRRSAALAIAGMTAAISISLFSARKPTPPAHEPLPEYAVPSGILGLELGMSLDDAKASGADVAAGEPEPASRFAGVLGGPSIRLPGVVWTFATTIGGHIARCQLEFAVEDGLSRVACDFDRFRSGDSFDAAAANIRRQLGERYDLPTSVCVDTLGPAPDSVIECVWSDASGSLSVKGRFEDLGAGVMPPPSGAIDFSEFMRRSELHLSLESIDHARRVEQLEANARREERGRLEDAQAERRARDEAERRRIQQLGDRGL